MYSRKLPESCFSTHIGTSPEATRSKVAPKLPQICPKHAPNLAKATVGQVCIWSRASGGNFGICGDASLRQGWRDGADSWYPQTRDRGRAQEACGQKGSLPLVARLLANPCVAFWRPVTSSDPRASRTQHALVWQTISRLNIIARRPGPRRGGSEKVRAAAWVGCNSLELVCAAHLRH